MKLNEKLITMMTKEGFTQVFWEKVKTERKTNPRVTEVECYECIEKIYSEAFGRKRYANFESFRRRRDEK